MTVPAFPIATTAPGGICFAFPNVCWTPSGTPPEVPIPYPSVGQLADAQQVSDGEGRTGTVTVGGHPVILVASRIPTTTGDEAGTGGGVANGRVRGGAVTFPAGSTTVAIHGHAVVRMLDPTDQNDGNARGTVLGGVPNVLVGG